MKQLKINTNRCLYAGMSLYFLFLKGNAESAINGLKLRALGQESQQPTPTHLIRRINCIIANLNLDSKSHTLVDFGCGDCSTLNSLDWGGEKIGIEYDKAIYDNAVQVIKRKNYKIDKIIHLDILDYSFDHDCIIFMYEPLWNCNNSITYPALFEKLKTKPYSYIIIYVTGVHSKELNAEFFHSYGGKILSKSVFGSIVLNRTIFVVSI